MKAVIYTTSTCAYCPMVKKWLGMKNIDFITKNADDPEVRDEAIKISGAMTVPVTLLNGQVIVGWKPGELARASGLSI